jgi:hypothetical protein
LILDVSSADLDAAELAFGPFHATTWQFRNRLQEAQRSWEQLRAEFGTNAIQAALSLPPLTVLTLTESRHCTECISLILITGQTYRAQQVTGTEHVPIQWRITRLRPPLDDDPYYVCRLADQSTQCDCAEWTYRITENGHSQKMHCKYLAALNTLGWL